MSDENLQNVEPAEDQGTPAADDTLLTGAAGSEDQGAPAADDQGAAGNEDPNLDPDGDKPKGEGDDSGEGDPANGDAGEGNPTDPNTYADLKIPEGMDFDQNALTEAVPIFQKHNISKEAAQDLVDLKVQWDQASLQRQVDTFNQVKEEWVTKSKSDNEFGGDKFDESVAVAQAAVNKFGTPEFKELLETTGVGSHPEVIRFMVNVGRLTAEDVPGGTTVPLSKEKDRVNILYPNDRKTA